MPRASDLDTPLGLYKLLIGVILGGFSYWMLHTFVQPQEAGLERMLSVAIINALAMLAFICLIFAYQVF